MELDTRSIPISNVHESPFNPRRLFNQAALEELANSVKEQGVLNPLVVRPVNSHFEVVAGARRRRAAEVAGLAEVPCIVKELDDTQAREIALIDNLQREDVHPMHEALSFKELLESAGWDIAKLAARMGKHERHIHKRVQLCNLSGNLQQDFVDGYLSLGAAMAVAKLDEEQQRLFRKTFLEMPENRRYTVSANDAERWIESHILVVLGRAPFDKEDAELVPAVGPCTTCPKRTGNNPMLWESVEEDRCTDPGCYDGKLQAYLAVRREKLAKQKKGFLEISDSYRDGTTGALGSQHYVVVPRGECEYSKDGLVVEGMVGKVRHVCASKDCKRHHQFAGGGGHNIDRERQRKAECETQIRQTIFEGILRRFRKPTRRQWEFMVRRFANRLTHDDEIILLDTYKWEKPKGGFTSDDKKRFYARIPFLTDEDLNKLALAIALVGEAKVFTYGDMKRDGPIFDLAPDFGIPVKEIVTYCEKYQIARRERGKARVQAMKALPVADPVLALPAGLPIKWRTWKSKDGKQTEESLVALCSSKPDAAGYLEVVYPSGQHVAAKPGELRDWSPVPELPAAAPEKKKSVKVRRHK